MVCDNACQSLNHELMQLVPNFVASNTFVLKLISSYK